MVHVVVPHVAENASLYLIRILLAVSFAVSSYNKAKNFKKFSKSNGVPVPVARVIALAEICAAGALITGILTQLAALGLMLLMLNTLCLHLFKWHSPYWAASGGWEYDLMLFALASVILLTGGGPGIYPWHVLTVR